MNDSANNDVSDGLTEREARVVFSMIPEIGPVRFQRIVNHFGGASRAVTAGEADWRRMPGLGEAWARRLHAACRKAFAALPGEMKRVERAGARLLVPEDEEYPPALKTLADAPFLLYIRGDWTPRDNMSVALVGSRQCSPYGRAVTERLSADLARAGVTVVSGLARGIDTAAHAAALKNKGRTVGVLGSGLDDFYPPENKALSDKMAAHGAVVSEFAMTMPPDRGHFPRRNRLIAGLSMAVVVVEAREASGALITARLAADQGREVFAVPGPVSAPGSAGPHRLLKQGARLAENVEDILEGIELFRDLLRQRPSPPVAAAPALSGAEGKIYSLIGLDPVGLERLAADAGLAAPAASAALVNLELKGLVRLMPGQNYVRTELSHDQITSHR